MSVPLQQKLKELGTAVMLLKWAMDRPDPFFVTGPAVISFSGGRTSAYMLWRILQAHGGKLPDDVVVCFSNTGREMEATLRFVRAVETNWSVPVVWLEYCRRDGKHATQIVNFETADRTGKPFEGILSVRPMLPSPMLRYCTTQLKVRTTKRYIVSTRKWKRWTSVVGLRADEPGRVVKATDPANYKKDRWDVICPLFEAGIQEIDVLDFWRKQPFRLELKGPHEGNCDGCFLKRKGRIARMLRDYPERMDWWAEQERQRASSLFVKATSRVFRKDRPSYADMAAFVAAGGVYKDEPEDDLPCDDLGCGI